MGIITKGMGAIMKGAKKRKTLTISIPKSKPKLPPKKWKNPVTKHPKGSKADLIERIRSLPKEIGGKNIKRFGSGPTKPEPRAVIIKKKSKPSKTKLAAGWKDRRIDAINRKIKPSRGRTAPDYAQEASDIYSSKALTKKQYKANQKQMYSLPEKERYKVWKIQGRRKQKGK